MIFKSVECRMNNTACEHVKLHIELVKIQKFAEL